MSNSSLNNNDLAIEYGHKFDFYFIALVFTILGLSIQTAPVNMSGPPLFFELVAWVFLCISGFAGLSRAEWVPVAYRILHTIQKQEEICKRFEKGLKGDLLVQEESGEPWAHDDILKAKQESDKNLAYGKEKSKDLHHKIELKYKVHRLSFLIGIVLLIIARAIYRLGIIAW